MLAYLEKQWLDAGGKCARVPHIAYIHIAPESLTSRGTNGCPSPRPATKSHFTSSLPGFLVNRVLPQLAHVTASQDTTSCVKSLAIF